MPPPLWPRTQSWMMHYVDVGVDWSLELTNMTRLEVLQTCGVSHICGPAWFWPHNLSRGNSIAFRISTLQRIAPHNEPQTVLPESSQMAQYCPKTPGEHIFACQFLRPDALEVAVGPGEHIFARHFQHIRAQKVTRKNVFAGANGQFQRVRAQNSPLRGLKGLDQRIVAARGQPMFACPGTKRPKTTILGANGHH